MRVTDRLRRTGVAAAMAMANGGTVAALGDRVATVTSVDETARGAAIVSVTLGTLPVTRP